MPWANDPESRRRSDKTYRDPEYVRNRQIVLGNAGGRCQQCGRPGRKLQVDHVRPVSQGGGHGLDNLQALCSGPGSCHARKTAADSNRNSRARRAAPDPPAQPRTRWHVDGQ